ncbi:MAG: hypothetical protein AB1546_08460 [bacterium]
MKIHQKHILFLITVNTIILCCLSILPASAKTGMTNVEVEAELSTYNEAGYKYLEKIGESMWKVLYGKPNWKFSWEVIVASSAPEPENSFIVIGTTVLSTKSINLELLLYLLNENSFDTNPGNYSIFTKDDEYFIQYAVKIPQMLMNEVVLKEGIGFVAGYSNSHVRNLEKLLAEPAEPNEEPSEDSSQESKPPPEKSEDDVKE